MGRGGTCAPAAARRPGGGGGVAARHAAVGGAAGGRRRDLGRVRLRCRGDCGEVAGVSERVPRVRPLAPALAGVESVRRTPRNGAEPRQSRGCTGGGTIVVGDLDARKCWREAPRAIRMEGWGREAFGLWAALGSPPLFWLSSIHGAHDLVGESDGRCSSDLRCGER